MLLSQKYAPKKVEEVLGNVSATKQVKRWMLMWMRGTRQRPLMISGPPGIGKTAMVYALRDELGLELLELSASDFRDKERIERILGGSMSAASLLGKQKLIFIDDVDAMAKEDRGGVSAILKLIADSPFPVILTAQDSWDRKITGLRNACTQVDLKRPIAPSIARLLHHIAHKEGMKISEAMINAIAENAHGDIRAAINDLHASSVGERDRQKDIFRRLSSLFSSRTYAEARAASFGDVDHDMLKLWIDENIPIVFPMQDLPAAYNMLSRADIFDGRIMSRQAWGFLRYSNDLMTAGVVFSRAEQRPAFVRFQFPAYLRKMKETASTRALMKSVLTKIGKRMHTSPRQAESFLPIFAHFYSENPEYFQSNYGFEEKEGEFLLAFAPKVSAKRKTAKKEEKQHEEKEAHGKKEVREERNEEKLAHTHEEVHHHPNAHAREKEEAKRTPHSEKHPSGREKKKEETAAKPQREGHRGPKLHEFF
ncbi:MAG: replication factor C large subunit [Candidatus Bilamarchaeaceae archaeon]